MRWAIEIQNTQLERRNLEDLLGKLGFALVEESPYVAFSSPAIDQCSTAGEVFELAKKLRDVISGPAKIDPDFQLGAVIDYSAQPKRRHYFLHVHEAIHLHSTISATVTVAPGSGLSEEQRQAWQEARAEAEYKAKLEEQLSRLEPAYFSAKAEKVLELLAVEKPTGVTLFKLYELMRGPSQNGASFGREFGITDDDYRRFKAVVHHDSVSGDWARHAHGEPTDVVNPMTTTEAEAFVRGLAAKWLQRVRASRST